MTDININDTYYNKYLKYKLKYLKLKHKQELEGGVNFSSSFSSSSSSSNLTQQTLSYFEKKIKELEPKSHLDTRLVRAISPKIYELIPNLKKDLTNKNSTFNQELLNNFVTLPIFTIIIFDKIDEDTKNKKILVNFTYNFNKIENLYKYNPSLNKEDNENIIFFKNELTTYIDLYLKNMEYKEELKTILTIYLDSITKLYELVPHKKIVK
jgi:hypothetical protein